MCVSHIYLPEFLQDVSTGLMINRDFPFVTVYQGRFLKPKKSSLAVIFAAAVRITSIEVS
jgi:hypothetical protein